MEIRHKVIRAVIGVAVVLSVACVGFIGCASGTEATEANNESTTIVESAQTSVPDYSKQKANRISKINKKYTKYKKYMSKSQKKKVKKCKKNIKKATTISSIESNYKKAKTLLKKIKKEHSYGDNYVQASCYGPYEGECTTATGRSINDDTPYIAVPMGDIVSKSTWEKMSYKNKMTHFYYHEKIYLKKGNRTCVAYVEDCGGFGSWGTTYNGKYCKRQFDLTPYVFHSLGVDGVGIVRWHY